MSVRKKNTGLCSFNDCTNLAKSKELCSGHYQQSLKGRELTPLLPRTRVRAVGATRVTPHGYVVVNLPSHPMSNTSGWVYEHRLVMSELIGRPLYRDENVHHKNGVKTDNRPENLELWSTFQPQGQKVEDLLQWAQEIFDRYGEK